MKVELEPNGPLGTQTNGMFVDRRAGTRRNSYERHCRESYRAVVHARKEVNIERAIKKFKRKFDKTGVVKELRRRQQFDKPSELKRVKMAHARYVQSLHANDDK